MDHTENLSAATLYNLHNQEGDSQEGVPKPPFDVSSFDYYQYVSVDAIESVKVPYENHFTACLLTIVFT